MQVDRKAFFEAYLTYFSPILNQAQVDGYDAIFDRYEQLKLSDDRWLAYILATVYHETGEQMEPVREGFCRTDEGSIEAVTNLYKQGKISKNYADRQPNGNSYFGRGLVQLTWADNYKGLGNALGIGTQLYDNPSLALDLTMSVKILFKGMLDGLFTGCRLDQYFNVTTTDWLDARRIINGTDKADLVAKYAKHFHDCLAYKGAFVEH